MSDRPHPSAEQGWPAQGAMLAGRYRLRERIGEGGMAAVYLAVRVDDGVEVALKVLRPELAVDPEVVRRFLQEARAASMIRHPKIVGILDFGFTDDGVAFLVMERLVGDDLARVLERDGPFSWARLAPLLLDVCAALSAAHERGIVHRDVKPENCFLLAGPDGQPLVKVLDFGIAKDVGGSLPDRPQTATGMLCGSPEYLAPEVIMGKVAEAGSDIYALGITIYELLCGSHPFAGAEFGEMLACHVQKPPPSFASRGVTAPPGVEALVQRCLAKHPDQRPADMEALAAAIRSTLRGDLVAVAPTRRRRWPLLLAAAGAIAAVGIVALLLLKGFGAGEKTAAAGEGEGEGDVSASSSSSLSSSLSSTATTGGPSTSAGAMSEGESASTTGEATSGEAETEASTGESSTAGTTTGADIAEPDKAPAAAGLRRTLSKSSARRTIRRRIDGKARACLREHTTLVKGQRFTVKVTVDGEGQATAVATVLPKSPAARCIADLFGKVTFGKSKNGVSFSHSFSP